MPVYVYVCTNEDCKEVNERLRPMTAMDAECTCIKCQSKCRRTIKGERGIIWKKRWIPTKEGWVRGDMG